MFKILNFVVGIIASSLLHGMDLVPNELLQHHYCTQSADDQKLEELFHNIHLEIKKIKKHRAHEIPLLFRNDHSTSPFGALSSFIINHERIEELRTSLESEMTIACYQLWHRPQEIDIEILAIKILETILQSKKSIEFIFPILSRLERYIFFSVGGGISRNTAMSFFMFSVISRILIPYINQFPEALGSIKLIRRMVCSFDHVPQHEQFLKRETSLGIFAFRLLDQLACKLDNVLSCDPQTLSLLDQRLYEFKRMITRVSHKDKAIAPWDDVELKVRLYEQMISECSP